MAPYLGSPDVSVDHAAAKIPQIYCTGSPHEIGLKHGSQAKVQVSRTIAFYARLFQRSAKLEWDQVRQVALTFRPLMQQKWPRFLQEIQGVADGAQVELSDILACNVRTEIAFGLFSDGCTALSWRTESASFLAQNWDWEEPQKQNLIALTIQQADKPTIKMITEAGLIGKIGLNSSGVGVCLNAIRTKGMDPTRLPCHLGLRMALESRSCKEAVAVLESYGVASACHMLIADATGGVGLEWSASDLRKCTMNGKHQIFHSNHYVLDHDITDSGDNWLVDSDFRVKRIEQLATELDGPPTTERLFEMFCDETNYPAAICRAQKLPSEAASLFNIIMNLKAKTAEVTLGRPTQPEGHLRLFFS